MQAHCKSRQALARRVRDVLPLPVPPKPTPHALPNEPSGSLSRKGASSGPFNGAVNQRVFRVPKAGRRGPLNGGRERRQHAWANLRCVDEERARLVFRRFISTCVFREKSPDGWRRRASAFDALGRGWEGVKQTPQLAFCGTNMLYNNCKDGYLPQGTALENLKNLISKSGRIRRRAGPHLSHVWICHWSRWVSGTAYWGEEFAR